MAARPRKELDPKSKDFPTRFARHLRGLLEERQLQPAAFLELLNASGVAVSREAVKKWISGDRFPRVDDLEGIGAALGMDDYRQLLPPPKKR